MVAIAYFLLQLFIIRSQQPDSLLKKAIGRDWKGKISPILYALAIILAYWRHEISIALYVFVALIWLVPDRRIERIIYSK